MNLNFVQVLFTVVLVLFIICGFLHKIRPKNKFPLSRIHKVLFNSILFFYLETL